MSGYAPTVAVQIAELETAFTGRKVNSEPDGDGGAYVIVDPIDPGPAFVQRTTWLGFHLTNMCPDAAIYPVYLGADLQRVDGAGHKAPFTPVPSWHNRPALQFSARTTPHVPERDTAATKVAEVIEWLAVRE